MSRTALAGDMAPRYPALGNGRWVDVLGLRTWWTEAGAGDQSPLVLVYGGNAGPPTFGGGNCAMVWADTFEALAEKRRVITYDRPGNGFTAAPARDDQYTMQFVIEHLVGFLEALDCGPVHLLGHSRGGYIVTRTALERQDLVRSVTIVTSGTLGPGIGTNAVALAGNPFDPTSLEGMTWVHEHYSYLPAHVTRDWMTPFADRLAEPPYQEMLDRIVSRRLLERYFIPGLASDKRETLRWLDEGRLQRPVNILWGLTDPTVPAQLGYDLFSSLARHDSRVTLNLIDRSGHFPYREHPAWFRDVVNSFLEEVDLDV
jgi:2-hydroxy-6-oxonona-2,4-dienedioate hydrolase